MITRPFLNSDPPALLAIWNAQPEMKQVARHLQMATLEHFVLAKPYFSRKGLLLAIENDQVIGFVHAGFGPNAEKSDIGHELGIICAVQTLPDWNNADSSGRLIQAAEEYLFSGGAQTILGGPVSPYECFYHGLSSTGESAGVPMADRVLHDAFLSAGYSVASTNTVLSRDLAEFRPPFDRRQRMLQRDYDVIVDPESELDDWWERCRFGPLPRCAFHMVHRWNRTEVGQVIWWDQAFTGASLESAVAFSHLEVAAEYRRQGFGTLIMTEAMKQLKASGALVAATQVNAEDQGSLAFFDSLGFRETAQGTTFVKRRD